MIDTTHRFQGHGSLRFVYQRGQTIRGQHCSLKYVLNRRRSTYRAAVVVSKKVSKSAVVRNRIRRRLYEAIRTAAPNIRGAYDIVFIVYSDQLAEIPAGAISKTVAEKLEKAGIFGGHEELKPVNHGIVDPKENKR